MTTRILTLFAVLCIAACSAATPPVVGTAAGNVSLAGGEGYVITHDLDTH